MGRLSLTTLLLYGLPVLGVGFMWNMLGVYFLKFCTDVLLVPAATIGLVFGGVRIWDAVSDPLAGYWSDRTRTRLGRRRPWLHASALPLGVLFVTLWSPPASVQGDLLVVWLAVCLLLFHAALACFRVPHAALGAELSADYHERTRVFASSAAFESVGGLLGLAGLAALASETPSRNDLLPLVLCISVLAVTTTVLSAARLRERSQHFGRGASHPLAALRDVFSNPHARQLLLFSLLSSTGFTCVMVSVPYACQYVLGGLRYLPIVLTAFLVPCAAALPLWTPLSRRFGKRRVLICTRLVESSALAAVFFVPPQAIALIAGLVALAGAMDGAAPVLGRSLLSDVIDFDEHRTGERKEGAYFAADGFVGKLSFGVGVALTGLLLEASGFRPGDAQPPLATLAIRALLSFAPLLFTAAGVCALSGFRLDERAHRELRRGQLDRAA